MATAPDGQVLQIRPGDRVTHSFPLLRVVQLAKTLARLRDADIVHVADFRQAHKQFHDRIHLQLSESHITDGGFDAADLVFALEGWLLSSPVDPDLSVVDEVFRVLTENQKRNPYWRPLRPFKATQQGLVLLPQSVEIANSLLRICNEDALQARDYFSTHLDLLERYARWLYGRVFRELTADGSFTFTGWESEHTYALNRIHLWQTSQALIFLQHYTAMLRRHIAWKLLRLTPLVPEPLTPPPIAAAPSALRTWRAWKRGEPFSRVRTGSRYRVYERIEADFLRPRLTSPTITPAVSMLLYGPPGTGKTSIARKVAESLGFPLLTVTPSDFITGGGEAVEARAKAIFEVLTEQRNTVVLFDEIDHLLLDRESRYYHAQGDIFKLLTPGMLSKLNKLADAKRVIFVIATNYYERIDRAIKRPGRIDARYLVLPPDLSQRERELRTHFPSLRSGALSDIARQTACFTYHELKVLRDDVAKIQLQDASLELSAAIERGIREAPPIINLGSYDVRLGRRTTGKETQRVRVDTVELPLEEIAMLTLLEVEARGWPEEPVWLADVVKEALQANAVLDRDAVTRLLAALRREKGGAFIEGIAIRA